MSDTVDEQPKKVIAKQLVTPKRKYFMPATGTTVEAESTDAAVLEANKLNPQEKVGDE